MSYFRERLKLKEVAEVMGDRIDNHSVSNAIVCYYDKKKDRPVGYYCGPAEESLHLVMGLLAKEVEGLSDKMKGIMLEHIIYSLGLKDKNHGRFKVGARDNIPIGRDWDY